MFTRSWEIHTKYVKGKKSDTATGGKPETSGVPAGKHKKPEQAKNTPTEQETKNAEAAAKRKAEKAEQAAKEDSSVDSDGNKKQALKELWPKAMFRRKRLSAMLTQADTITKTIKDKKDESWRWANNPENLGDLEVAHKTLIDEFGHLGESFHRQRRSGETQKVLP